MPPSKNSNKPARSKSAKLARVVDTLRATYGPISPPPASSAFALILWEKVAYLATDEKRMAAFRALEQRVGLAPQAILAAKRSELEAICASGGAVGFSERAKSMQDSAALVLDDFDGDLDTVLARPTPDAKRALMRFYGVGEPGAERILLLMRAQKVLPLDSNGARTMVRLGYGADDKNYTRMYRSVSDAARAELRGDFDWLIDAHVYLRHHGREVCKTSAPRCEACAVRSDCAYGSRLKSKPNARL
jgi:endonuclease-3